MSDSKRVPASLRPGAAATLVGWLVQREEAMRARLAHVLHRDVAGTLAAVRIDIARILGGGDGEHEALHASLRRVDELVEQALRSTRCETQRLRPALIDHFGLAAALRHRVGEASRTAGFVYTLELVPQVEGVARPLQLAAYRAVECLLEVPGLDEILIRLDARRDQYLLKVAAAFAAAGGASADTASALLGVRTCLESLGASWSERATGPGRRQFAIRLPCAPSATAQVDPAPPPAASV